MYLLSMSISVVIVVAVVHEISEDKILKFLYNRNLKKPPTTLTKFL